jgi:chromosome segregation ATPase
MGRDAILSKRRVINTVDECVTLVNNAAAIVEEVREKHAALLTDLEAKHTAIEARFDAQGRMVLATEDAVARLERVIAREDERSLDADRDLDQRAKDLAACIETRSQLQQAFNAEAAGLAGDLTRAVKELRAERDAFERLTFWQRLAWLFTGRWVRPLRQGEGINAVVAEPPTLTAYAGIDRGASL